MNFPCTIFFLNLRQGHVIKYLSERNLVHKWNKKFWIKKELFFHMDDYSFFMADLVIFLRTFVLSI